MTAGDAGATDSGLDEHLPDEAIVVRGGLSTPDTLQMTALAHHDEHGVLAISVRSRPGVTAEDLVVFDPPLPHQQFRQTRVGVLRAAGYDVVADEPPPTHALIMLPRFPADYDYVAVAALFGEPQPNPIQNGAG